jgi:hypothetical protein
VDVKAIPGEHGERSKVVQLLFKDLPNSTLGSVSELLGKKPKKLVKFNHNGIDIYGFEVELSNDDFLPKA